MAGIDFTTRSIPVGFIKNSGGLNSTASPIGVADNEASDLQNIDFDRFGAFQQRNGFSILNQSAINSGATCTSLHYFENKTTDVLIGTFGNDLYTSPLSSTFTPRAIDTNQFDGSGLDDVTWGGTLSTVYAPRFEVEIDATGTPDTFQWRTNLGTWTTGVAITGSPQALSNGITITFAATTGHTLNDKWFFYPTPTISAGNTNLFTWVTFNNKAYGTNGVDFPIAVTDTLDTFNFGIPPNLTRAKYIETFENYCFLANCTVNGVLRPTRLYWSTIDNAEEWDAADFVEIGLDDGEEITGLKKLGDRIVIYKERSVYVGLFTGDADIPFVFKKTPSEVGCVSHWSIQEARNGQFFFSVDGIYFFDGFNSTKLSDRISSTFDGLNKARNMYAVSIYQKVKNKYWLSLSDGSTQHDTVITYDFFNNAFSVYKGIEANALTVLNSNGQEQVYFGNYAGFCCRADIENRTSDTDATGGVDTGDPVAIESFYKTKWFDFGDVVLQKGVAQSVTYYDYDETTLTISYAYDLSDGNPYTQNRSLSGGSATWQSPGTGIWSFSDGTGGSIWAAEGGSFFRVDHIGRGRLMRLIYSNDRVNETFKINAFGLFVHLETHAG